MVGLIEDVVGLIAGRITGVMFLNIGPRDLFAQILSRQMITRVAWFLAVILIFLVIFSFLV